MVQVAAQEEDQAGCGKDGRSATGSECKVQRDQDTEMLGFPAAVIKRALSVQLDRASVQEAGTGKALRQRVVQWSSCPCVLC